jgi:geranylgeranyl transferase type-2 subunit alpha
MHGRLKVRSSAEQEERKRVEREKKLATYKQAMSMCINIMTTKQYNESSEIGLKISAEILANQPDIATLWNMRREIILYSVGDGDDFESKYLNTELSLTETCLRKNPKS